MVDGGHVVVLPQPRRAPWARANMGTALAVLLADLAPGEVQEHVVERWAVGPDGAHRHTGGRHDGADGGLLVGHEGGEPVLGALDRVARQPRASATAASSSAVSSSRCRPRPTP